MVTGPCQLAGSTSSKGFPTMFYSNHIPKMHRFALWAWDNRWNGLMDTATDRWIAALRNVPYTFGGGGIMIHSTGIKTVFRQIQ